MTLPSYRVSLGVSTEKVQFSGVSGGKLSGSCSPLCSFTIEDVDRRERPLFFGLAKTATQSLASGVDFLPSPALHSPDNRARERGSEQAGKGDPFASNQPLIFHQVSAPRGGTFRKRPHGERGRQAVLEILRRCFPGTLDDLTLSQKQSKQIRVMIPISHLAECDHFALCLAFFARPLVSRRPLLGWERINQCECVSAWPPSVGATGFPTP